MNTIIDPLRKRVGGQMTRRDFALSLSALAMMRPTLAAAQSGPLFNVRTLNHVTLTVKDIKRSVEFYQKIFGLPLQSDQDDTHVHTGGIGIPCLGIGGGPSFVAFVQGSSPRPISHFCMGMDHFDPDKVVKMLTDNGFTGRINIRIGKRKDKVPELGFRDPVDGIGLQLQDVSYCGGSGHLGELCEAPHERPANTPQKLPAPVPVRALHGVNVSVADVPHVTDRWLKAFGMKLQARQGDVQILTVGSGPGFVAVAPAASGGTPQINHFCLGVERFDAKRIMKALEDNGARARLVMRDKTPEVFVSDPDNITIQLQDLRYCGGSGEIGDRCS